MHSLAKIVCFFTGHLVVDPSCLPDQAVKILHMTMNPDAICLRCQRLFDIVPAKDPFLAGAVCGFHLVPHNEEKRRAN